LKNLLLTTSLLLTLIFTVSSFTLQSTKSTNNKIQEPREDYGCLHEDHSQYEDGDSLNLEAASYSNNH